MIERKGIHLCLLGHIRPHSRCGCGSCVVHHVYLGSQTSKMRPIYAKTIVCRAVLNLPKSSVPRKRGVVKERVAERRIAEKNVEVHPRGKLAIPLLWSNSKYRRTTLTTPRRPIAKHARPKSHCYSHRYRRRQYQGEHKVIA